MFILSPILGPLMSLPDCPLTVADTAATTSAAIHFIGVSLLRQDAIGLLHDVNGGTCSKYSAPQRTKSGSVRRNILVVGRHNGSGGHSCRRRATDLQSDNGPLSHCD